MKKEYYKEYTVETKSGKKITIYMFDNKNQAQEYANSYNELVGYKSAFVITHNSLIEVQS